MKERRSRKDDKTHDATKGDQLTKQAIIGTICLSVLLYTGTICYLSLTGKIGPEVSERIANLLFAGLMGFLAKTGVDKILSPNEPQAVQTLPGDTVATTESSADASKPSDKSENDTEADSDVKSDSEQL